MDRMIAATFVVAIIICSCKTNLSIAEKINLAEVPFQVVDSMNVIQTQNGKVQMRVVAPKLEKYQNDSISYEKFPEGLRVFAYNEKGELESTIRSNEAIHVNKGKEEWKAYGNVVIKNIIKGETMETDTLYWDRENKEIYTDCYIRMYSPDGFMQGYGMRSDERAGNAVILRPFNSYTVIIKDTTRVRIDSANFIGPLLKKDD